MQQTNWQPSAQINTLRARAKILHKIRTFFTNRDVLEVETPVLSHCTVSDPYLDSFAVQANEQGEYFLQTSPEYHMKRLLCAGCESIFQICKSFRIDEQGRLHNPEFTMLEWYRVGFTHFDLMDEIDALLQTILQVPAADRFTYQHIFQQFLEIDPLTIDIKSLKTIIADKKLDCPSWESKDDYLMFLFAECIEPSLQQPTFIYNFPASQSALARLDTDDPRVSTRFELYYKGMELANGFYELANADEQRQRFIKNNQQRLQENKKQIPLDENFLQALESGLPDCAGVALGVDRLVMLALDKDSIKDVISFDFVRA